MARITIKNVGPLKEVSLEIKRFNVFMGPQSTGKSTIAKIISQALWAEKNFLTTGEEYDFYRRLLDFHKMDKNYFNRPDAEIIYESQWCVIRLKYEKGKRNQQTEYKRKENRDLYYNPKIEYIPAERNFVTSIENIHKYAETYNTTMSFLNDWYAAKSAYQGHKKYNINLPDLSFSYRYKESEERDIISMEGNEVELQSGSSGQQSLLPLLLIADEVMVTTYHNQRTFSPAEIALIKKKAPEFVSIIDAIGRKERKGIAKENLTDLWHKIGYQADYGRTHLIIEEPELNLYPSTQRGLLKHLVSQLCKDLKHQHTLTITTHSPYILYALNNCMLAGLAVEKKKNAALKDAGIVAAISPQDVGLWLLEDGKVVSLQQTENSLLSQDFFNSEFQKNHEEMFQLLQILDQ
ncbi:MAG: AAA family ATPase [Prevotella sp.]|nr:ATP-binding protein [Prevotella sp.]MDD7272403.1 AAA family ATPase [Prevotellaceae bacterium]MDY3935980.1 AAA family ATPase [Prevotella sp.]MDY4217486.1 AAA family ATPase [Prevotella sp.]